MEDRHSCLSSIHAALADLRVASFISGSAISHQAVARTPEMQLPMGERSYETRNAVAADAPFDHCSCAADRRHRARAGLHSPFSADRVACDHGSRRDGKRHRLDHLWIPELGRRSQGRPLPRRELLHGCVGRHRLRNDERRDQYRLLPPGSHAHIRGDRNVVQPLERSELRRHRHEIPFGVDSGKRVARGDRNRSGRQCHRHDRLLVPEHQQLESTSRRVIHRRRATVLRHAAGSERNVDALGRDAVLDSRHAPVRGVRDGLQSVE